jgi:outer membrane protein assembly factor BamB
MKPNGYGLITFLISFKTEGPVRSTAAISNGLAYFGSGDENLYAIDAKTGKERWHFKTGGAVTSSPAVAASVVFFTSRDGSCTPLNASDGKAIWKFQMGKRSSI